VCRLPPSLCALLCRAGDGVVVRGTPLRRISSRLQSLGPSARLIICPATPSIRLKTMCKRCVGVGSGLRGGPAEEPGPPSPPPRQGRTGALSTSRISRDPYTHTHSVAKAVYHAPYALAKTRPYRSAPRSPFPHSTGKKNKAQGGASLCGRRAASSLPSPRWPTQWTLLCVPRTSYSVRVSRGKKQVEKQTRGGEATS
jgi:hypothetical protein